MIASKASGQAKSAIKLEPLLRIGMVLRVFGSRTQPAETLRKMAMQEPEVSQGHRQSDRRSGRIGERPGERNTEVIVFKL